jgi:hypothetical protein
MSTITIHAGDFDKGKAIFKGDYIGLPIKPGQGFANRDRLPIAEMEEIDTASEESVKRVGGTVGWGLAGAAVLGPAGLLAGLLLGGRKKEVTFVARFTDDRKMMATTDSKTYAKLVASVF